ncbi:hypothetical protein AB0H12_42815 [Actinosynnema sp. NPDC023794]
MFAPAERADLLVDFSRPRGRRVRLTNVHPTAASEPSVMQFRVEDRDRHDRFRLPAKLSTSYVRLHHGTTVPDHHDHVFIGLVPPGTAGEGQPQMWEPDARPPERFHVHRFGGGHLHGEAAGPGAVVVPADPRGRCRRDRRNPRPLTPGWSCSDTRTGPRC